MRRAVVALGLLAAAGAGAAAQVEVQVRNATGEPLADAVVVIDPLSAPPPTRTGKAVIEQRDRDFVPYVSVVQKGTAVDFPNRDKIKHHVYSFSPAKTFELKLYSGQPAAPVTFDKTGPVALGCNIHDWMEAHVLVVDTPWFGRSDAAGKVVVRDLPAGRYRLRLWHPRQKAEATGVDLPLAADARERREFVLDVAPRVTRPKPAAGADDY